MESRALELVRTGEFTPGQPIDEFRQDNANKSSGRRIATCASRPYARWCADRADLLHMEAASGELYDYDADVGISNEHHKKSQLEARKITEEWNSRSAREIYTPRR